MAQKADSKKTTIVLNGLGRVGRVFLRIAYNNPNFKIAALNSRSDLDIYAHLLKYDSTYGVWDKNVHAKTNQLSIDNVKLPYLRRGDEDFAWGKMGVDIVVDATGKYTKREAAINHLKAGAKYMVATAPMEDPDETFVYGINHKDFNPAKHKIISAGSCTTVCSTLVVKVLEENFGIEQGFINTVHAVTSDQTLLDNSHKDMRRARGAYQSIIPTTTGVSKTIVKIYPHLKGKISAISLRVPVVNPSVVVFTVRVKKKTTKEVVNKAFTKASLGALKTHLGVTDLPLVSSDFRQNPNGAIVDLLSTDVTDGNFVTVLAWYDNEWGYVNQAVGLIGYLAKRIAEFNKK